MTTAGWFAIAELDHRMGPGILAAIAQGAPSEAIPRRFCVGGSARWCIVAMAPEHARWVREWTQEASTLLGKTAIAFGVRPEGRSTWFFHAGDFVCAIEQEDRHRRLLGDFERASELLGVPARVFHRYRFDDTDELCRPPEERRLPPAATGHAELVSELGLIFPPPDLWTEVCLDEVEATSRRGGRFGGR